MNLKMVVVCLSILILFFGIFSVSASDNTVNINDNLTNMESNTYDDIKVSNQNFDDGKLNAGNEYTFDDLQSKIDAAYVSGELNLDAGDFYNNTNSKAITISQTLTINGNGATISGATSFTVSGANVVLKNIKFINSEGNGIYWGGDNGVIGDCTFVNNTAGNSGGSVYWEGSYGVLGNCTFINSSSKGTSSSSGGGAVYWYGVGGVLSNCSFVNNTARFGGAVFWRSTGGVLGNCSFVNNTASNQGGSLYLSGANGTLGNCSFVNSSASRHGGAVLWAGKYGVLGNCSFVNNNASSGGGAVYWSGDLGVLGNCSFVNNTANYGGAVYLSGVSGILSNCTFINSSVDLLSEDYVGGAVYWLGNYGVLGNCSFVNNEGYSGGAVYWYGNHGVLGNCSFVNNTASSNGGAIYWEYFSSNGTMSNCSFVNNNASNNGGAVYWAITDISFSNCSFVNNAAKYGGAVYWYGRYGVLGNCSFVNNTANYGGAVYWYGDDGVLGNCSFVNNTASSGGAVNWLGVRGTLSNCSFVNNAAVGAGAAIFSNGDYYVLDNCYFINHTKMYFVFSTVCFRGSYGVVNNCSFVNNVASRNGSSSDGAAIYWGGRYGKLANSSFVNNTAYGFGGAVCWSGADGGMSNCTFINSSTKNNPGSSVGGAVGWTGSNGVLSNCSFINSNSAGRGAVYWFGRYGKLANCSFVNNTGNSETCVYWLGGDGVLSNCSFVNNTKWTTIYWEGVKGTLMNCSFVNNQAQQYASAVRWRGDNGKLFKCNFINSLCKWTTFSCGDVYWTGSYGVLSNCSFVNNTGYSGGAIYWTGSYGILANCSFVNNTALGSGGSVYFNAVNGTLFNCSFVNNTGSDGGAVYWKGNYGVLSICSFVNNTATNGGAVYWYGYIYGALTNCSFVNNAATNGAAFYSNINVNTTNCYFYRNLNALGSGIYLAADCNISNCRFDMTQIYIASGKVRLIDNVELSYQNNFTTNNGVLFLSGNDLKSYIINRAKITSPVTMIAFNNQTVRASSNKINVTALIYNDDKNIILDSDLRICVGSTAYNAVFDGVNYTAVDCVVSETKSVVSIKIQRSNNYTDITFKNGLILPPPQNLTVNVGFDVVKNDVLMLFNVTPTSFNDNLTVFVYNNEYSVKINGGKGNVSVRNLPAGNYAVLVYYLGSEEYNSYLHSFNFTVNLLSSQINITVGDYYAGSDVIIGVNLTDGASGLPLIYVDNKKVDYTALGNINLGKLAYGNHTVSVIYAGDTYYDSSFNMTGFLVKKNNSTISLNITDGTNDTSKKIIVEVTNGATGDVLIDVNGVVYRKSLSSSKATFMLDDFKNGTYTVVATYLGDEIYNSNSTSGSFEINATSSSNFTANVTVIIDGKNYTGVIVGGVYNVDLSDATPGIYNATVIYHDSNNNLINTTMTIAIPKWNSNIDVSVFNIKPGEVETIVVNVTRGATGTVLIDVNGTVYYKVLDNSRAELILTNLKSADYPVRVIYMGDDKYNNSTNHAEFIVGEGVVVSVFMDGKNPMLDVIVPQDAVGSVTVTISNKDYTGVINNRHAIINISDVVPNTYNITTSYTNTSGATVKGNATITVPKPLLIATVISVEYVSQDLMVTSVLKDIDGNVLANEEITYSMNGVIGKTTTDRDGLFKVKYVSNSTLYIEYGGNNVYEGSNTTIVLDKFVDLRNATKIISEVYDTYAVDFDLGERGGYFKFRLVDDNGNPLANKPVQIGFCGVVYNRVTDSEGNAQLQINLNTPFIFTFAIAFLGDDTHNASFVVQQINVVKKTTSVSAASKSYKASEKTKKFTVTLKSDKCSSIDGNSYLGMGKKITLKLNGKTYTAKTNMRNQAIFKLSISKKGSYNAEIRFEGDQRYAASKTTAKIKII